MSKPEVNAFFVGRALAQAIGEQVEKTLTQALSDLGKFDAEQRERLHAFMEQVMQRAQQQAAATHPSANAAEGDFNFANEAEGDLQATIDELRAEIARVRAELQRYRSRSQ
jgi:hypothetical protein